MYVVVVGAGKIGSVICQELAKEHEIVVIDKNQLILEKLITTTDVSGIVGSGVAYDNLVSAEVNRADVFIAVTASDEINMIACVFAKKMGAAYTIARVREHEYMTHKEFMRESVGIDAVINPEGESAQQIMSLLRFPSAKSVESFLGGRVNIAEYVLEKDSPLVGLSLVEFQQKFRKHVLICIVERDGRAIIPNGSFILESGDILHISGTSDEILSFYNQSAPRNRHKHVHSVLIVGGGRLTHYLLQEMNRAAVRFHIKVIENNEKTAQSLAELHPEVEVVLADGSNHRVLEEEGISGFDCFISLTGIDEENILISLYAKKMGLHRTIAKVSRSQLLEILGTNRPDAIINTPGIIADTIMRLTRAVDNASGKDVEALFRIIDNQVEALQIHIPEGARVIGQTLSDMPIKDNILITAIYHNKRYFLPSGKDVLHAGDTIIITTTDHSLRCVDDILAR